LTGIRHKLYNIRAVVPKPLGRKTLSHRLGERSVGEQWKL